MEYVKVCVSVWPSLVTIVVKLFPETVHVPVPVAAPLSTSTPAVVVIR
jgi:hypothetical protein